MLELLLWILLCFISGAIPWAFLVTKLIVGEDVRTIGDKNPGAANSWKLGGWTPGLLSLALDVSRA